MSRSLSISAPRPDVALAAPDFHGGNAGTSGMRVLLVASDTFPPFRVDVSVLFGSELAQRGLITDVIMQSADDCPRPYLTRWSAGEAWVAATDCGTSLLRRLRKHFLGLRTDMRLFGLLASRQYDCVIVKDKFLSGVLALIGARLFRCPLIYWLSFPFPEFYLERARDPHARWPALYRLRGMAFGILLYRLLLPRTAHIFVQSNQMREDIATHGICRSRMSALPMGVDLRWFERHADDVGAASRSASRTIIYLGTLSRLRQLDFLLRVLQRVRAVATDVQLILVGGGDDAEEERELILRAREMELGDAVTFTGQLPREEALAHVSRATVCLSPFRPSPVLNSTSPTKLIEYMALGRPVVASDHPEQRMVLEQSGGGLCVAHDEDAFAGAILRLLSDPSLAGAMGHNGRQWVYRHRSYARIADLVEHQLQRYRVV